MIAVYDGYLIVKVWDKAVALRNQKKEATYTV